MWKHKVNVWVFVGPQNVLKNGHSQANNDLCNIIYLWSIKTLLEYYLILLLSFQCFFHFLLLLKCNYNRIKYYDTFKWNLLFASTDCQFQYGRGVGEFDSVRGPNNTQLTQAECILECQKLQKTDPTINGVTTFNWRKDFCRCQKKMNEILKLYSCKISSSKGLYTMLHLIDD